MLREKKINGIEEEEEVTDGLSHSRPGLVCIDSVKRKDVFRERSVGCFWFFSRYVVEWTTKQHHPDEFTIIFDF